MHRADDRDVIDAAADVGKELADFGPAFAVRGEGPLWPLEKDPLVTGTILDLGVIELQFLAMVAGQRRLGVEGVDVRHAAGHEQEDDPLGLGREMRLTGCQRVSLVGLQLLQDGREQHRTRDGGADELPP